MEKLLQELREVELSLDFTQRQINFLLKERKEYAPGSATYIMITDNLIYFFEQRNVLDNARANLNAKVLDYNEEIHSNDVCIIECNLIDFLKVLHPLTNIKIPNFSLDCIVDNFFDEELNYKEKYEIEKYKVVKITRNMDFYDYGRNDVYTLAVKRIIDINVY